ncbi:Ig-like domain-containing protein [Solibacillus cecembensis]|uniref:Ig-like domain-containing protein n=1 Tax=Solibacillus cecembensis TaxID=459347 RepID=UPI003CFF5494
MTNNYSRGSIIQADIQVEDGTYPNDGRHGDGFWYVRKGVVNTAPTIKTPIPTQSTKKNESITINLSNYFSDPDGNPLTFSALSNNMSLATATVSGNTLTLAGKEIGSVWVTVSASDGSLSTSQGFTLNVVNSIPTVIVTSPTANMTLYENDVFNLAGNASDINANQSVTIYAQVNLEQRIVLGVGLSNAPIPFTKQLKFVGGKLYDGDTPITGSLTDGVPHTLKIWAQDGDGGQSAITERTFYVVPNRPPVLTVDTVQPNGIINTDKFTISGAADDPDGNPVTAAYRSNGGNSVALGITDGKWAFDIALAQLQVGQNTIVVELTDSYNFKVSKTIKLNKNEIKTPILDSVARYKIEPPKGSAKGVLLFIERDVDLDLKVELSMTLIGEQENYVTLTQENTAPIPNQTGIVEDTYYHEANEQKNNIILKLSTSRPDVNINNKIHLISGVVD